jgi:hypothetical protein
MANWDDIKTDVEKNGNVLTVTMEQLRDAYGAGKLGIHVRDKISSTLAGLGLGHVPVVLPTCQHELVRLYKKGTPVGDLIETVLTPGGQNDARLREKFSEVQASDPLLRQTLLRSGCLAQQGTWYLRQVFLNLAVFTSWGRR